MTTVLMLIFVLSSAEVAIHPIIISTMEICNVGLDIAFMRFYVVFTKTTHEFHFTSHYINSFKNVLQFSSFKGGCPIWKELLSLKIK